MPGPLYVCPDCGSSDFEYGPNDLTLTCNVCDAAGRESLVTADEAYAAARARALPPGGDDDAAERDA